MKVKTSKNAPIAQDTPELEAGPRLIKPTIMRETKIPRRPLR
jgi:hypothetical protein